MMSLRSIRAAIFVGGAQGTEEEAQLFATQRVGLPMYAIASTGFVARALSARAPTTYSGTLKNRNLLSDCKSYRLVAQAILDDLRL
jgi:hypothetical protein